MTNFKDSQQVELYQRKKVSDIKEDDKEININLENYDSNKEKNNLIIKINNKNNLSYQENMNYNEHSYEQNNVNISE